MPSRIRGSRFLGIVPLLSPILLVGCISATSLSHTAVKYNEAVEEAQSRMLLLNVVRAKLFRPMYITDLTDFSGSIKLDVNSGGIETDFVNGKGLTSGKLTPSIDYVQNPTFTVNVISSQEFMKGFTTQCSMSLLQYYWDQGWPPEFLLYMFVHHVDVMGRDGKMIRYENYPDPSDKGLAKLERFGEWVTDFVRSKPRFVRSDAKIGSCLSSGASDLGALVNAKKEGLSVVKTGERWQLEPEKSDLLLMSSQDADDYESGLRNRTCDSPPLKNPGPVFQLRSPEGILFYLGELMRVEQNFKRFPAVCIGNRLWPLFVAFGRQDGPACKAVVAVHYEGTELIIPDRELKVDEDGKIDDPAAPADPICSGLEVRPDSYGSPPVQTPAEGLKGKVLEGDRLSCFGGMSMESFSLLTQLIALQKSAQETPTTSLVRAIVQ